MNREEAEQKYQSQGLKTQYAQDEPHKTYPPDSDIEMTFYTLGGSVKVKIEDGDWQELHAGDELTIKNGQLHEAVVGPEGWEHIIAWADPA